jgi:outer membrane lipoprotein carrier protein
VKVRACVAWLAAGLALGAAPAMPASSGTALDRYLTGLNSLSATFTQTVTDTHGSQLGAGSGRLIVQRPGKFRWDYQPKERPAAATPGQILVADGKNLWFYDSELAQVTVKPVEAALSSTPIVLLSGSAAQLHDSFEIEGGGTHDALDWVEVKPRSAEADFSHASLGFAGDRLARMIINDRLGQTVQLDFPHSERNAHIDAGLLKFEPPKGVDVIGSAQN